MKTEDGRVFALSTGDDSDNFGPGQVFRTENGRFFTLAIAGQKGFLVPAAKKPQDDATSQEQSLFDGLTAEQPRRNQPTSHRSQRVTVAVNSEPSSPRAVTQVKSA